ncbi:phage tail protein [Prevotella sp.]|uniref:phage tail protein n=1 Tax=Prevotella sp. TaxID=59823 RepID=UPI003AB8C799
MVVVMADVDITSLSVEISAESQGAELNIDKLATAISNLRTKGNVTKVVNSLDRLAGSIATLKQASAGMSGLDKITNFLNGLSNVNTTASAKSINTVVNAIKKIPAAVSGLNGVDFYSMSGSITQLTNALAPLSILDASNLKALGSAFNAIGKVPDLTDKLKATDLDSFASSCQKISTALTPLASQLDKVGNAFAKLPPQLSKVVTQANRVTAANEKQRKSYLSLSNQMNGFMRNMAKLVSLKAIAEYLGNAVAKFNDFYEATDLFHNAMGNLSGEADTLISKMQGLLGVDPTKAMTYMATIQSLGTSFGLTSDKAYVLSKNLTQLAYDEGSYWNKDVAETFTAMSSAISGEIEPIRRLGIDLTQARLQQELLAFGFNKQVSSLSQADKAVLRYIAIMKQTANIQGNLAQTIQSPANQIKILKAQLDMLAKSVGSLLYPAMKSILPPLIAAVQLIREFVEWVAKLMGVKVVFTDFTKSADSVGGIGDAMDETTDSTKKAAKALKDYTMGFDELNIIDPTQGSSGSGAGAGAAGNLLGDVDLSGYDMFKDYVGNTVDEIKEKVKKLLPIIAGVAAGFAAWKIADFLFNQLNNVHGLAYKLGQVVGELRKKLGLVNPELAVIAGTVALIVWRFVDLYQNSEKFRIGLQRIKDLIELAALGFSQGWNISLTEGKLGQSIEHLKESIKTLAQQILDLLPEEWKENASNAFETIRQVVKKLDLDLGDLALTLVGIGLIISGHPVAGLAVIGFEAISVAIRGLGSESEKESFDLKSDWHSAFQQLGIDAGNMASFFVDGFAQIADSISDFIRWIKDGISESERLDVTMNKTLFPNALLGLADLIADIETFVRWVSKGPTEAERLDVSMNRGFIANALLGLADLISDIGSVIDWFVHLDDHIKSAGESFARFLDGVENWAAEAGKAAANMVNAVADAIASLPLKMYEAGKNVWQGLVKGIQSGISNATGAAANLAKAIIDKFTTETDINSPSKLFEQFGIYVDQGLANGITAAIPYVATAMQGVVDAVQEKGNALIAAGSTQATGYVNNFLDSLDTEWQRIDQSLQTDFFGSIGTLWDAISNGDLEKLGTWAASYFYHAMDDEQRKQIKSIADNSLQWLTQGLSGVWNNIAGMASSFINQFVPSAVAATSAQTSLNIAMDANPVMLVISLIGMLVGALVNFANKNKSVSTFLQNIWYGVGDFFSIVFESILRVIGTAVQGFVDAINALIWAWNKVPLHSKMDYVSNPMYDWADKVANERKESQRKRQEAANSSFDDSKDPTNYEQQYKELLEKYKNGSYPGTKEWDKNNGTSSGSYGGTTSVNVNINEEEMRESVYNGTYNAFLDIFQRYGDELTGGKELKIYLDGKQITASVEKRQNARGQSLMGSEVYSY